MPESFDPYAQWLGVHTAQRPPNHYALLGLEELEGNRERIVAAADRALAQVRKVRPGALAATWQKLLDELSAAKSCLLDPSRKQQYDQQFKNGAGGGGRATGGMKVEVAPPNLDLFPPAFRPASPQAPYTPPVASNPAPYSPPVAAPTSPPTPSGPPSYSAPIAAPVPPSAPPPNYAAPPAPYASAQPSYPQPPTPYAAPYPSAPAMPGYPPSYGMPPGGASPYGAPTAPGYAHGFPPQYPTQIPTTVPATPQYGAAPVAGASYGMPPTAPQMPAYGAPVAPSYGAPVAPSYRAPASSAPAYQPPQPAAAPNLDAASLFDSPDFQVPPAGAPSSPPLRDSAPVSKAMSDVKPFETASSETINYIPRPAELGVPRATEPARAAKPDYGRTVFQPIAVNPPASAASTPLAAAVAHHDENPGMVVVAQRRTRAANNTTIVGGLVAAGLLLVTLIALLLSGGDPTDENTAPAVAVNPQPQVPVKPVEPRPEPKPVKPPVVVNNNQPQRENRPSPAPPRPKPEVKPEVKPAAPPEPQPEVKPQPMPQPAPMPMPVKPEPEVKPQPQPEPPAKPDVSAAAAEQSAIFNRAIRAARKLMSARDTDGAKVELAKANNAAMTDQQKLLVEQVTTLNTYVGEFWNAVTKALMDLQVADMLTIGSSTFAVVEVGPDLLTIHQAQRNYSYTKATMPIGVAKTLAERWFDPKMASTKVFIGAFLAVDPNGEPEDARRLWSEATLAGATVDDLLPLLEKGAADAVSIEQGPLPDAGAIAEAEKVFHDTFRQEINSATTPQKKLALSKKLVETAASVDRSAERYVLFMQAVELSTEIGNAAGAVQTLDELAKWFKVEVFPMKADALEKTAKGVNNSLVAKAVTRTALELLEQALDRQLKPEATRLAEAALTASRLSKDGELVRQAQEKSERAKALP